MNKLTTVEIIARFNEQCFADNHFTDAQLLLEGSIDPMYSQSGISLKQNRRLRIKIKLRNFTRT